MSDDKEIGAALAAITTIGDLNFVSASIEVLAAASVPRTVTSIFVNGELLTATNTGVYYAMMVVTDQSGTLPTLPASDMTALNTWVDTNKAIIWCTQMGFAWPNSTGQNVSGAQIIMEPGTARKLAPGQKIMLILCARNHSVATGQNINYCVDWNLWFNYS